MFRSMLLGLFGLYISSVTFALNGESLSQSQKLKIQGAVQDFYLKQVNPANHTRGWSRALGLEATHVSPDHCFPEDVNERGISCVEELCKKEYCSGTSGREIAEACRGANGRCVQELCKKEYCSGSTGKEIARACRGSSSLCVEELCKKEYCSGSTGKEVAQACNGSDGHCVVELCRKEYCSGTTGREIARSCAGN